MDAKRRKTEGTGKRFAALIFLVLLSAGATLYVQPARAAGSISSSVQLEVGFSPATLGPVTDGVPVFTWGDTIWVMSSSSTTTYSVQLLDSAGDMVSQAQATPGVPVELYTLEVRDGSGAWSLVVEASGSSTVETIPLTVAADTPVPFFMTGDSISRAGVLNLNFSDEADPQTYGFLACAFGSSPPETVSVPIPTGLGVGTMLVALNGSNIVAGPSPVASTVTNSFDFWVELYQNYSYIVGSSSTLVSRDVEVGSSAAVPVSPGENSVTTPFSDALNVRPGMFSVRVFFHSSSGFYAAEASVLLPLNLGHWLSLQGCVARSSPTSSSFALSSTLNNATTLWPREVYLIYDENGIEAYSGTAVPVQPVVVDVVSSPWGAPLSDSELTFVPGPGIEHSTSEGEFFYAVASFYPVEVGVSLLPGQRPLAVAVPTGFTYEEVLVNSSRVVVQTQVGEDGAPASGANITVSFGNTTLSQVTRASNASVFYLPPGGSYDVTGAYAGVNRTVAVSPGVGTTSTVTLSFPGPPNPIILYETILTITAVAGSVLAILVWAMAYRGMRGWKRLAKEGKP